MPLTSSHNDVSVSAPAAWPARFGKVTDEFAALRSTCGVHDLPASAKIKLTGSDRVRWLNGMVTNNVRDLAAGHGVYAFLLNPQGHILGDMTAFHRGDHLLLESDKAQLEKLLATFDHYIIMDDVEVATVSEQLSTLGLTGPKAAEVLKAAGIDLPEQQPLEIAEVSWQGTKISVIRGDSETYPSYSLWIAPEHAATLRRDLVSKGALLVGQDALEIYRIALGMPRYGKDIRERDLPQETEQARALNFSKGCYVGQEIVERIRSRGNVHRKFTGFRLSGAACAPGTKIQAQGKDVGEVTSSVVVPAPDGEHPVALGYVRRELAGEKVDIAGSRAIVTELPFADLLQR